MLTQVTARIGHTHTASVQKPQALVTCSIGMMIGGAKYVSFRVCERVPNGVVQQSLGPEEEHSSDVRVSQGCQSSAMQRQKQMRTMVRLCKCTRRQGWVEPGGGMFFCWSVMPPFEGMHTWQLFVLCRSRQLTLTPLLAHFFSLFLHYFFSLLFFSFFQFFLLSLFLHFFLYFFYLFFGKTKPTPTLICMDLIVRCPPISPTLGSFYLTTQNQMCAVGSSFRLCSITKVPGC